MRRSRSRHVPDNVLRAARRQHPELFTVPETKPFERVEPVQLVGNGAPGSRPKYGNKVVVDKETGQRFDSQLELRIFKALVAMYGQRNVARQMSFMLSGGVRMRPDFVVLGTDNCGRRVIERVIDAKGAPPTRDWTNKAKQLAEAFDLHVEIVRKVSEL